MLKQSMSMGLISKKILGMELKTESLLKLHLILLEGKYKFN